MTNYHATVDEVLLTWSFVDPLQGAHRVIAPCGAQLNCTMEGIGVHGVGDQAGGEATSLAEAHREIGFLGQQLRSPLSTGGVRYIRSKSGLRLTHSGISRVNLNRPSESGPGNLCMVSI